MQEYLFQFPGDITDAPPTEPAVLKAYDAQAEYPLARLSPDMERARQLHIQAKQKVRIPKAVGRCSNPARR